MASNSNSNNDHLQQQLDAAFRRAEAAELAAAQEREGRLAAERANAKLEQLYNGMFYATINEVWKPKAVHYNRQHFSKLFRIQCPGMYERTVEAARNSKYNPADEPSLSRSSVRPGTRNETWPTDIFGEDVLHAHIAHLVPASSQHASMYDDVASWAMGLLSTDFQITQQQAIHGSRPQLSDDQVSQNIRRPPRIFDSGLKHSTFNKIRLLGQKEFFDVDPCVIIVPIMSLDEMLEWNGEGYSAIVMAQDWDGNRIDWVCQGIGMARHTGNGDEADETLAKQEEVEQARFVLEQVVCGLAFSLFRPERPETAIIRHYKDALTDVRRDRRILVPSRSDDNGGQHFRVKKVTFLHGQHPPPDPLLLAVKAAAIWSQRNQHQIIAHGEVQSDSVDDDDRQMDIQAEEHYWDWLRESYRPKDWNDLAAGLGQPNGFRPDSVDDGLVDSKSGGDDDDPYDLVSEPVVDSISFNCHVGNNGTKISKLHVDKSKFTRRQNRSLISLKENVN